MNDWKPHLDVAEGEQTLFIDKMLREQTAAVTEEHCGNGVTDD